MTIALLACAAPQEPRRPAATGAAGAGIDARVQRVVDGDTLKVRLRDGRRKTVRLIGIDTPETVRPGSPVECGGPEASALMRRLVLDGEGRATRGRRVVLVRDPSQDAQDRYGRTLAYVDAAGRDVGLKIVTAGWAQAVAFDGRYERQSEYDAAEATARERGRGMWRSCR